VAAFCGGNAAADKWILNSPDMAIWEMAPPPGRSSGIH